MANKLSNGRIALLLISFLVSLYLLVPSVIQFKNQAIFKTLTDEKITGPWYKSLILKKALRLGLDLQGGLHLVLGVDLEKVVQDSLIRYKANIEEELKSKNLSFSSVLITPEHSIVVSLSDASSKGKLDEWASTYFQNVLEVVSESEKEIVYSMNKQQVQFIKTKAIDQTIETLRNRIDEFGVAEPVIQRQGDDRVIVQFPGEKDSARIKNVISQTAKLEFKIVDNSINPSELRKLVTEAETKLGLKFSKEIRYTDYRRKINEAIIEKLPAGTEIFFTRENDPNTNEPILLPTLLNKASLVTGEHLSDAFVSRDEQFGEPYVAFSLTPQGAPLMEKLTGENVGKAMAIVLDENVRSAPVVQSKISDRGRITLGGGKDQQAMMDEANDTAIVLKAGALPTTIDFLEERTIGATLGSDAIQQGFYSMLLGAGLVVAFMILIYSSSGVVAILALTLNVLMIFALMAMFESTLTLPGVAGIVLTMGMAVDANIIIHERIREELKSGKALRTAIEIGYEKSFWSIMDSNLTTAIAGIVLLNYGTGPIRGFAVTLLIGIFTTVFTALNVSKTLTYVWMKFNNGEIKV